MFRVVILDMIHEETANGLQGGVLKIKKKIFELRKRLMQRRKIIIQRTMVLPALSVQPLIVIVILVINGGLDTV